eukprot:5419099-Ditylum_brightwellii.AAC.1
MQEDASSFAFNCIATAEACIFEQRIQTVKPQHFVCYKEYKEEMPNDSWYNTFVEMERKRGCKIPLQMNADIHGNYKEGTVHLVGTHQILELRTILHVIQCELCRYHTILEEVEKIKKKNERLMSQ